MVENKLIPLKSILIFVIVLFALIASLSVASYLSSVKNIPLATVQPTATPTLAPFIAVSDWKTYRNEKYGFELTFPDNWEGYKVSDKSDLIKFSLKRKNLEVVNDTKAENYGVIFAIKAYSKDEWKGIYESLAEAKPIYAGENENYVFGYSRYLIKPEDEELFDVHNPSYDVNTKIIPTFKFTGKELSDGWENYRNEKYGYEIKYPEGLFFLNKDILTDGIGREYKVFYEYTHYWNLRENPWVPYPFFNGMGINILEKINGVSVKSINNLDDIKDDLIKEEDRMGQWGYDFVKITFKNGISALRMYRFSNKESSYIYYIKIQNKIVRIVVIPAFESLDQYEKIISTFKFL